MVVTLWLHGGWRARLLRGATQSPRYAASSSRDAAHSHDAAHSPRDATPRRDVLAAATSSPTLRDKLEAVTLRARHATRHACRRATRHGRCATRHRRRVTRRAHHATHSSTTRPARRATRHLTSTCSPPRRARRRAAARSSRDATRSPRGATRSPRRGSVAVRRGKLPRRARRSSATNNPHSPRSPNLLPPLELAVTFGPSSLTVSAAAGDRAVDETPSRLTPARSALRAVRRSRLSAFTSYYPQSSRSSYLSSRHAVLLSPVTSRASRRASLPATVPGAGESPHLAPDASPLACRASYFIALPSKTDIPRSPRFPYLSSRHSTRPSPLACRAARRAPLTSPCRRRARPRARRRPAPRAACRSGLLLNLLMPSIITTRHMPKPRGRSTATAPHRDCATSAPLPHMRSLLLLLRAATRVGSSAAPQPPSFPCYSTERLRYFWPPRRPLRGPRRSSRPRCTDP